jgi:hypothetical protein
MTEPNWPASSVELWSVAKIRRYAGNAKSHPPEQIREIAASMKEFGVTTAILLDEKNEIIAGHGRLDAAELLKLPKYPIMRAKGWSEAQKRAYRLADNVLPNIGGAAMLPDMVKLELEGLEKLDFDISRFGLNDIDLPELEIQPAPKAPRRKTTIFVSVRNLDAEKAAKIIAAALNKAKIEHNL